MDNFGGNFSLNSLPLFKNLGNRVKNLLSNQNQSKDPQQKGLDPKIDTGKQNVQNQSLANTNSNINLNQSTLTSQNVTQGAINSSNKSATAQENKNINQSNTAQSLSQGAKDLPVYASIPNISMKSWVANQQGKSYTSFEKAEKELKATLEGIKGFQRESYDNSDGNNSNSQGKNDRRKMLLILSDIFGAQDEEPCSEIETISKILNFKKLGSNKQTSFLLENKSVFEEKLTPPHPREISSLEELTINDIKQLKELYTLPEEFPEALRLFSKDDVLVNPKYLKDFLNHRSEIIQSQIFNTNDKDLKGLIERFIPLLNSPNSLITPLILLYYPLPLPYIKQNFNFESSWKKERKDTKEEIIASCDVYYSSLLLGRFLMKFKLHKNEDLTFDIETSEENKDIVKELEFSISESMYLLEKPPTLSSLNALLTREIYEATDQNEELSITSTGPLRIEIIVSVYSVLMTLNKLSSDFDPSGIIEISD